MKTPFYTPLHTLCVLSDGEGFAVKGGTPPMMSLLASCQTEGLHVVPPDDETQDEDRQRIYKVSAM